MTSSTCRLHSNPPRRQRGVVLMVALIVLVALTLAGLSMVRSADTGVTIAGNLSFRQAATHALDAGVEAAIKGINTTWVGSGNTINNKYYAYMLADADNDGLPDGVDFSQATPVPNGVLVAGYTARYVVERMCVKNAAGTAIADAYQAENLCNMEKSIAGMDSNKLTLGGPLGQIRKLHYRVTVQVTGPRNTETYAQVMLAATMN